MNVSSRPECPLCRGSEFFDVGIPEVSPKATRFLNAEYRVVCCPGCRFYFVFPSIPFTEQQWEILYGDHYFGVKASRWWENKQRSDRGKRLDWLECRTVGSIHRFLDLGCGEGHVLLDAYQRGWEAHGIDICDNRIESVKEKPIRFIKGDVIQAAFPEDHFDAVHMDSVLEHIADPLSLLNEVRRILRKGGCLYLSLPNEDCLMNDFKKVIFFILGRRGLSTRLNPFRSPYHIIGFSKESLFAAAHKSGFSVAGFRNFAGETEWLKYPIFTKTFLMYLALLPIYLTAIPLRRQIYYEALFRKESMDGSAAS
jgi:SAM-dependent methyltransferase